MRTDWTKIFLKILFANTSLLEVCLIVPEIPILKLNIHDHYNLKLECTYGLSLNNDRIATLSKVFLIIIGIKIKK